MLCSETPHNFSAAINKVEHEKEQEREATKNSVPLWLHFVACLMKEHLFAFAENGE